MRITARLVVPALLVLLVLAPQAPAAPGENGPIAYQRFFKGGSEIFSIDPATEKSQRLTSNEIRSGDSISAGGPAYSPTGRKIVFINAVKVKGARARRNNVFVMRANGSNPEQLTRSKVHLGSPAFTADGRISYSKGHHTFV